MAVDAEITMLLETLEDSHQKLNEALADYATKKLQFQKALREKADAIVEDLKKAGQGAVIFRNRSTSVQGWILKNYPATEKQLVWPESADGFVLLYARDKSFWYIDRGRDQRNLSIETTGDIKKQDIDRLDRLKLIWDILKQPVEATSS